MNDWQELLSFRKMITPMIIQILFYVGAGISVVMGLMSIGASFTRFGGAGTFFYGLVLIVFGPVLVRVWCELTIIFFRINETLEGIKDNLGEKQ